MRKDEIIQRLKEWRTLIKHFSGTGIFGWCGIDEKAYQQIIKQIQNMKEEK